MRDIKIFHSGDWHIGNFPGPDKDGKNARFLDICGCLDRLVEDAEREHPDVIILSGDIFHAERVWASRGLAEVDTAIRYIRALRKYTQYVIVIRGTPNHDGERAFASLRTAFEDDYNNVCIVTNPTFRTIYDAFGTWGLNIALLPGFDRGYYRAKHPGLSKEEENEFFTNAVSDMILGLKANLSPSEPSLLASHFTITGCNMESGQTAFLSQFEPVVHPQTLAAADFDLVCFGHIHRPQKLDGCRNTYYCGALTQLNFNDEGQERGYWMHVINGASWDVTSTFCAIPSREHLTIRLDDAGVEQIIGGDCDIKEKVADKIVRVLYDCTDEHNKAFNHAAHEQALYAAGAFWVQEITPQKITITADRRSMDADNTPEDNLIEYLKEHVEKPEDITAALDLARPIISEATEKASSERNTGIFVPLEIEVKNYRNYRQEKFSFDGIRFCTINGNNGVGKSSLFMDAMVDALFEETREGDLTGWICNDPDVRSGAIMFTFRIGDKTYRVTRTRQKSGKATLNIAELVDGEWADRSKEKFRDTQQEIVNIIGMDSLMLKACALIMQDQYGLFLQADKEARMAILGNILGLGVYGDMEDAAAQRATDVNREIRLNMEKVTTIQAGLPDVEQLAGEMRAAEAHIAELEADAAGRSQHIAELKASLQTRLEASARLFKLRSKVTELTAEKARKEAQRTQQAGIIYTSDAILAQQAEIEAGVSEYNALLNREKELIAQISQLDSLTASKTRLAATIAGIEEEIGGCESKASALMHSQIVPLKGVLQHEDRLRAKNDEYIDLQHQLAEARSKMPQFYAARDAFDEATKHRESCSHDVSMKKAVVDGLSKKMELLESSGCPYAENAQCKFLADAIAAKQAHPAATEELHEAEKALEMAQEAVKMASDEYERTGHLQTEIERLSGALASLEASHVEYLSFDDKKARLADFTEQHESVCNRAAELRQSLEASKQELSEIEAQLNQMQSINVEYRGIREKIDTARIWLEKEKQLPVEREKKATASERFHELGVEIETIDADIASTQAEITAEETKYKDLAGVQSLQALISIEEEKASQQEQEKQAETMKVGALRQQIEEAKKSAETISEIQRSIADLGATAAIYETLKKAFSQDGIPHNVIRSIIPMFEATATNILGQMSQGKMSVEFVTEKTLKSNSKKEVTTLDIVISDNDTGRLPYMSRSGGERVKAALSIILALAEIKSSRAGIQFGFLFVDEPPFLDQTGVQAYCDALEAIQRRYSDIKIMAITHDPAMKSRFPQSVDVVKTADGSKVIYE